MAEKLTEELLDELVFGGSLTDYLGDMPDTPATVPLFLEAQLRDKGLKKSAVIRASRLNTTFAYQLFSGDRNASKDKLLQLAFALGLDLQGAQRLLRIAGAGELYCKKRRDAIIIHCITQRMSLADTDETLFGFGEPTLYDE